MIYLKLIIKEFLPVYCKKRAMQEKVVFCFSFGATVTHRAQKLIKLNLQKIDKKWSISWDNYYNNIAI